MAEIENKDLQPKKPLNETSQTPPVKPQNAVPAEPVANVRAESPPPAAKVPVQASAEPNVKSGKSASSEPEIEPAIDPTRNIERLLDVEMNVTVRFGKTEIPLREAVNFGIGSMIELNRSVDEPVDLLVNNFPFARGEVVVIDGYYGVKVTEIGSPEERSHTLLKNAKN